MTATGPAPPPAGEGRPSEAGLRAWRAFLHAYAGVFDRLSEELENTHGLSPAYYDVLLQLATAPGRRLRMRELAAAVLLSRSGLTRLVDRMAADGLVRREACSGDARGVETVLTDTGLARLRQAAPTHLAGIAAHVTDLLDESELAVLERLLSRLARAAGRPVPDAAASWPAAAGHPAARGPAQG